VEFSYSFGFLITTLRTRDSDLTEKKGLGLFTDVACVGKREPIVGRSGIVRAYDETRDPLLVLRTRQHANFYSHGPVSRLSTAVSEHTLVGSGCDRRFLLKDQDDYITPVDQGLQHQATSAILAL
jgi:hypothetical protein